MRVTCEQWEDALRNQRYPFAGAGDIVASPGQVVPQDLFLDLNLMVEAETDQVALASIQVQAGRIAIYRFEFADGTLVGTLRSTTADTLLMPITLGTLTVGYARIDTGAATVVRGWTPGAYTVGVDVLAHLLVISPSRWRSGFRLPDGTILTGEVFLVADRGLWLERTSDGFRLHVTGDPFAGRDQPSRGLLTVNGQQPDADGNINLIGLGQSNFTPAFVAAGDPFRLTITPGQQSLTVGLSGTTTTGMTP